MDIYNDDYILAEGEKNGVYPHGQNARQFAKMVEWGMTPMEATQPALETVALVMKAGQIVKGGAR